MYYYLSVGLFFLIFCFLYTYSLAVKVAVVSHRNWSIGFIVPAVGCEKCPTNIFLALVKLALVFAVLPMPCLLISLI